MKPTTAGTTAGPGSTPLPQKMEAQLRRHRQACSAHRHRVERAPGSSS